MIEVKKTGKYKMRNGKECEVYGFDDLGTGTMLAEGFDSEGRHMKHWNPDNGKIESTWAKKQENSDQYDIVEAL